MFALRMSLSGAFALIVAFNVAGCPQDGLGGDPSSDPNAFVGGSGDSDGGGAGGSRTAVNPTTPILFVADNQSGILSFRNPAASDGDVEPATHIFGNFTRLDLPSALAVDRFGDLLSLSADNGIAVVENADTASGDLTPARRLAGGDTQLTHQFTLNAAMLYDRAADRVFVCNSSAVLIWDNFSGRTRQGNTRPDRTIISSDLNSPRGLSLGDNGDLYVTATTHVAVFREGATRTGNIRADRIIRVLDESSVIAGSTITMDSVFVDRDDRLYVFDSAPGAIISVLDRASGIDGTVAPDRTIDIELPQTAPGSFAPEFFPAAIVVDANGTGFVSDLSIDAIHVIPGIGEQDGTLAFGQAIVGRSTEFDEIAGLFIWE